MPQGWERRLDSSSGKFYYLNHATQTTHWDPPGNVDCLRARADPTGGKADCLPTGGKADCLPTGAPSNAAGSAATNAPLPVPVKTGERAKYPAPGVTKGAAIAKKGKCGLGFGLGKKKQKRKNIFGAAAVEEEIEEMPAEAKALMKNMGAQTIKAGCQSSSKGYYYAPRPWDDAQKRPPGEK